MQSLIYQELICSKYFDEFQIFKDGTMNFCLEIMAQAQIGDNIENYLKAFFDSRGIVSYHGIQRWDVPFGNKINKLFGGLAQESEKTRVFKERWFKLLLADSDFDVSTRNLDEIEELIQADADIGQRILRNFQDPFKLPDGRFWKINSDGKIKKCLVFYDKNTGEPFKLFSDSGKGFNVFMDFDLQKMLDELGMDPKLLQNPITFSISKDGRFIVDFNPVSGSRRATYGEEVADVWIRNLREKYNIPEDTLERLRLRIGSGTGVDLFHPSGDDEMIKLFALILADFKRNCDETTNYLKRKILEIGHSDDIIWGTEYSSAHCPPIHVDWNQNIHIGDTEVELYLGQPNYSGRPVDRWGWEATRGVYSLGTGNSWLARIIGDIKIQALNLVFSFPGKANAEEFFSWVTTNWNFIN